MNGGSYSFELNQQRRRSKEDESESAEEERSSAVFRGRKLSPRLPSPPPPIIRCSVPFSFPANFALYSLPNMVEGRGTSEAGSEPRAYGPFRRFIFLRGT